MPAQIVTNLKITDLLVDRILQLQMVTLSVRAVGIGDVCIELPNGQKHTKAILKKAIYAPDMAFTSSS